MADESLIPWREMTREGIKGLLQGIYDWFRNRKIQPPSAESEPEPKPGILIIGPGGTGKSTLAKLLTGDYDWLLDSPWEYRESFDNEHYRLADDPDVEIVVPPGQYHRRESTWAELHASLAAGKYRGVIVVSAYGYHSLVVRTYKLHPLYERSKERFLEAYLEDRRADELRVLRQLAPHLRANRDRLWLLSVIGKEDLWYPERLEIERHYREGDYAREVEQLLAGRDQRMLRHEYVFASLVISNFDAGPGERLRKNAEGYDHGSQVASVRRLVEAVSKLKTWEESR